MDFFFKGFGPPYKRQIASKLKWEKNQRRWRKDENQANFKLHQKMKIESVLRDMISDKINLDYYENQKQNRAGVQTKTIQSIWNGTERYWARKQDSETPWLRFSQNPYSHTRRFSNFSSKSGHSSLWKQFGDFSFPLQHSLTVTSPRSCQMLISLFTHIPRSPSVSRLTITPWFALTRA